MTGFPSRVLAYLRVRSRGRLYCQGCRGIILTRVDRNFCSAACARQYADDMAW